MSRANENHIAVKGKIFTTNIINANTFLNERIFKTHNHLSVFLNCSTTTSMLTTVKSAYKEPGYKELWI